MAIKDALISAGFAGFRLSGLHRLAGAAARGCGVILAFHRVRPWRPETPGFTPNRLLEITPEFLDETLGIVKAQGLEIVTLDEARRRLLARDRRPFAALTFDDGYLDTGAGALPILERHGAPFTVFCAIGFIERSARLWWLELEEAIRRFDEVAARVNGGEIRLPARTPAEKSAAYEKLYWTLRARPEAELLDAIGALASHAGVDSATLARSLFLDWDGVIALNRHPLATIGAHSVSHRRLALWPEETAREEMTRSRRMLEERLGTPVRHFAYPVGDRASAAKREFDLAEEVGFATAVTTRPGMLFLEHAGHLTALPRVSINGLWQSAAALDILLSGAPFLLWNRGRRVDAA
jgi:peptidoglycan/xylan/chitin deacetylase (PgdA/CDA1 family)